MRASGTRRCAAARMRSQQFAFGDAADQILLERVDVHGVERVAYRVDGHRPVEPLVERVVEDVGARLRGRRAVARSSSPNRCTVMPRSRIAATNSSCSSRARCAHSTSSKSSLGGVGRGQPVQLKARPVDDDLPEVADLGADVQSHGCLQADTGTHDQKCPGQAIPERLRGARPHQAGVLVPPGHGCRALGSPLPGSYPSQAVTAGRAARSLTGVPGRGRPPGRRRPYRWR